MITNDPDLVELSERIDEASRELDAAREQCRRLLHNLTDARIGLDSARRALADFDDRPVVGDVPTLPLVKGSAR